MNEARNMKTILTDPRKRAREGAVRAAHKEHAAKVPHAGKSVLRQGIQEDETDESNCQAGDDTRGSLLNPVRKDSRGKCERTSDGVAEYQPRFRGARIENQSTSCVNASGFQSW